MIVGGDWRLHHRKRSHLCNGAQRRLRVDQRHSNNAVRERLVVRKLPNLGTTRVELQCVAVMAHLAAGVALPEFRYRVGLHLASVAKVRRFSGNSSSTCRLLSNALNRNPAVKFQA